MFTYNSVSVEAPQKPKASAHTSSLRGFTSITVSNKKCQMELKCTKVQNPANRPAGEHCFVYNIGMYASNIQLPQTKIYNNKTTVYLITMITLKNDYVDDNAAFLLRWDVFYIIRCLTFQII